MNDPSEHVRACTPPGPWRGVLGAIILLLLGSTVPHRARSATAPSGPVFAETACDLPHLSPEIAPRVRCGTVSVPRDYGEPDRGSFKLAVVVVGNTQQPTLPDPVVYINGGPGSPLTTYADYQARHPYAASRDLILVDQRGVGRSEPRLCPGVAPALLDADLAVLAAPTADAQAEAQARRRSVFMACRDEARAQGIDLDDFGTAVTAEDFEQVRQALGIARWNVVGESYGTTVAMTLMARHPKPIRSAVLDSLYPPDPLPPSWARAAEARAAFFALCERDPGCATAYPDPGGVYRQTLDQLGRARLTVAVPPRLGQPGNRAPLTASMFEVVTDNLLYFPSAYPSLPRLIAQVHNGDTSGFAAALAAVLAGREALDTPANTAVECRDRPQYREALIHNADALEHTTLLGICGDWAQLGPAPVIPTGTDIPTLVLAGQFDPNASPALSHQTAELIGGRAHWVEFPLLGHNVRQFSPCASGMVAAFIETPAQMPDTSCSQRRPPIRFLPR
jgi:pimeloyl-ACP methyl ester carboxylesterase